jgi:hydroxyacylglutathione hydrolase
VEPAEDGGGPGAAGVLLRLNRACGEESMILKRFYEEALAQASFLVGCARTGEAAIIDPNRDIETYLEAAAAEQLRITAVTETHIHADYLSGSRELAERTGATLYLSDEGDADWKYGFAHQSNVRLVRHGDTIRAGNVRLDVVRTPGHTPEHVAFVLTDEAASSEPLGVFTGDFIFVGDVGRPDLLERAANIAGTMEKGARTLFRSLDAFKGGPDRLLLWPGHGAGSACGKSLGGVPVSTLGYEKLTNWGLRAADEERFVAAVLAGQPEPPAYFGEMKRLNKEGPPILGGFKRPRHLAAPSLPELLERGETVVDIRSPGDVAAGYIPGILAIPLSRSFVTWAGSLLPFGRPVHLLASSESDVATASRQLALVGFDQVPGWFGPEALDDWRRRRGPLETMAQLSAGEAARRFAKGKVAMLDVRGQSEYVAGHVPGARHIPLGSLAARLSELPRVPLVVHCASGVRSVMAVSLLRKAGVTEAINMTGGFREYTETGLPVETGAGHEEKVAATP